MDMDVVEFFLLFFSSLFVCIHFKVRAFNQLNDQILLVYAKSDTKASFDES